MRAVYGALAAVGELAVVAAAVAILLVAASVVL